MRLMPYLDHLRESIEARIVELNSEIATLTAARTALRSQSAVRTMPSVAPNRAAARGRERPHTSEAAANGASGDTAKNGGHDAARELVSQTPSPVAPRRADRRARAKAIRSEKRTEVLLAGKLELMLRESADGLSATTIAKRSNAGYTQVLDLLRDMEKNGQIRRTGSRRTSLWRLITDEERIAERTAELESLIRTSGR
jgi:hypothetical protein